LEKLLPKGDQSDGSHFDRKTQRPIGFLVFSLPVSPMNKHQQNNTAQAVKAGIAHIYNLTIKE
jgi:hypothetical protein